MIRAFVIASIICQFGFLAFASADDSIAERLAVARKKHADECDHLRQEVEAAFEKREGSARQSGNKKLLDQLALDRRAFEDKRELPSFTPDAARRRVATARLALESAYNIAIKQLIKANQDVEAQSLEKELREYLIASHAQRFLSELTPSTVEVDGDLYSNDGKIVGKQIKIEGREQSHSIFLHAKPRGHSLASYRMNRNWSQFRGEVFIPRMGDERGRIGSPVTFEIIGDNKVIWSSKPIQDFDQRQVFEVDIDKVDMLHLRVKCAGNASYARAVWIEPKLFR
ncbi:MAG: NPCBM/NEW2 domain-containing protein [Planctomycetaceae bacterium]